MKKKKIIMKKMLILLFSSYLIFIISCKYNKCIPCIKKLTQEEKEKRAKELEKKFAKYIEKRLTELKTDLKLTPLFEKWHFVLKGKKLRKLYICDNLLIAETEDNLLYALDRNNGIPQWIFTVGDPLDANPLVENDKIYFLSMAQIYVLDKKTGELLLKKELHFVPSSPFYIGNNAIYIGGWDNFLYALEKPNFKSKLQGFEEKWKYRIDGYVRGTPVLMDGILFFPGTDNNIYAINGETGDTCKDWGNEGIFKTRGPNIAEILAIKTPPYLYVSSRDYNLYCIDRQMGNLIWKFESGGELIDKPIKVSNSIYLVSQKVNNTSDLYCLDSETGKEKWKVKGGRKLYFIGKYHDWIIRNDNKVVAVDTEKRKIYNIFDLSKFSIFTTLLYENTGYMGTKDGFIFAVEER